MKGFKSMHGDENETMSKEELMAKMEILEELRDQMAQLMGDKMKGDYEEMSKVSVMADSKEDLLKGLGKAEEVVEEVPEFEEEEDEE